MFALVKTVKNLSNEDTQVINLFAPYTIWEDKFGTKHSPDSLLSMTADQKQDAGIYDVAYATRPDDRFYIITSEITQFDQAEKIVKVSYTSDPKPLTDSGEAKGLKSQWIAQTKQTANSLLAQTDWMLVRKIERNVDVPAETAAYRAAVVAESDRVTAAIEASTNVIQLIAAIDSTSWPSAE